MIKRMYEFKKCNSKNQSYAWWLKLAIFKLRVPNFKIRSFFQIFNKLMNQILGDHHNNRVNLGFESSKWFIFWWNSRRSPEKNCLKIWILGKIERGKYIFQILVWTLLFYFLGETGYWCTFGLREERKWK